MTARVPLVADYVRAIISEETEETAFRELLLHLMAQPGRILSPTHSSKWPILVLEWSEVLGGDPTAAVPAAAAVELVVAAIDVVDDLVDDDWNGDEHQQRRAMNASLGLSWLAQRCTNELAHSLDMERADRIRSLLAHESLTSISGQDLDLRLETVIDVSEALAHEMTSRKSGSLVRLACQVGAIAAGIETQLLDLVGNFGYHTGMVAQLLNDLADVDPTATVRGSDLRRRKKTLPVAYALRS